MTLTEYHDYFEGCARRHSLLRHGAGGRLAFVRGEVEEFFQRFRSEVSFPCLILESSECAYPNSEPALTLRHRTGAFIIADTYGLQKDYDDMQLAMQRCERIAEDIIGRMLNDSATDLDPQAVPPFTSVGNITMQYLQNQPMKYVGARVELTVTSRACLWVQSQWIV